MGENPPFDCQIFALLFEEWKTQLENRNHHANASQAIANEKFSGHQRFNLRV